MATESMLLIREKEEVVKVLELFDNALNKIPSEELKHCPFQILNFVESARCRFLAEGGKAAPDNNWYEKVGAFCKAIIIDHFRDKEMSHDQFAEFLLAKHKGYGASPIMRWKHWGILMRIDSKINRFQNLTHGAEGETVEPRSDTINDIIGYCVLGIKLNELENK